MARLESQAKGGFYPTPPGAADRIMKALTWAWVNRREAERSVYRALDPCCGTGDPLRAIADHINRTSNAKLETFGIELNHGRPSWPAGSWTKYWRPTCSRPAWPTRSSASCS